MSVVKALQWQSSDSSHPSCRTRRPSMARALSSGAAAQPRQQQHQQQSHANRLGWRGEGGRKLDRRSMRCGEWHGRIVHRGPRHNLAVLSGSMSIGANNARVGPWIRPAVPDDAVRGQESAVWLRVPTAPTSALQPPFNRPAASYPLPHISVWPPAVWPASVGRDRHMCRALPQQVSITGEISWQAPARSTQPEGHVDVGTTRGKGRVWRRKRLGRAARGCTVTYEVRGRAASRVAGGEA